MTRVSSSAASLACRLAVLAVAVLASGLPLRAEDGVSPDPVQRYRVFNVAAGDVLNVRYGAGADTEIIGSFKPDASGIVVTGSVVAFDEPVWWGVVTEEGKRGWVRATYLQAVPESAEAETFPLACFGAEPFWSLEAGNGQATYTDLDDQKTVMEAATPVVAAARTGFLSVALSKDGKAGSIALIRSYETCTDGMSESEYPYEAVVSLPDGTVLAGCCERAGP